MIQRVERLKHQLFSVATSLVSTYVVCERLSVMHDPAGVVENLVQNSTVYPYSAIQNTPPPPRKLKFMQIFALCDFLVAEYPPHNENSQKSWHFDFSVAEYPPSPLWENSNLGRSCHFVSFQFQNTPPPGKFKFRQILPLCVFSVSEYPPPQENSNLGRSCHFVSFQFQNTPLPPGKIQI